MFFINKHKQNKKFNIFVFIPPFLHHCLIPPWAIIICISCSKACGSCILSCYNCWSCSIVGPWPIPPIPMSIPPIPMSPISIPGNPPPKPPKPNPSVNFLIIGAITCWSLTISFCKWCWNFTKLSFHNYFMLLEGRLHRSLGDLQRLHQQCKCWAKLVRDFFILETIQNRC